MTQTLPLAVSQPIRPAQQKQIVNLVRRAAKTEILPRFQNMATVQIATKSGPFDLVTEADTAAEAMIARGLARLFPGVLIVGEEAVSKTPKLRDQIAEQDLAFIVDPIDGTWNFANGLATFGVIISATRFGKPVFGLLYDALNDDYVIADSSDDPARHVSARGTSRPIQVAQSKSFDMMSGYIHFSLLPKDEKEKMAPNLLPFAFTTSLRCSCHEYRLLSRGRVDFILSTMLNPWDHAAGVFICEKAGGVAKFLDGEEYNTARTQGQLLTAATQETWDALRDHFDIWGKDPN